MALQGSTCCEVDAATGNDLNAGWFNRDGSSAGTDYTYGAGQALYNITDLVMDATTNTKCTSPVSHPFTSADVRNYIRIPAGITGFTAGLYEIISVSVGVATLSNSPAATSVVQTTGNIKLGGSLATPIQAMTDHLGGCQVYIKYNASAYAIGVSLTTLKGGGVKVSGYNTTRDDLPVGANRPILQLTANTLTMFSGASFVGSKVECLICDGNSKTGSRGMLLQYNNNTVFNCKFTNFTNTAIWCGNSSTQVFGVINVFMCEFTGCTATATFRGNYGVNLISSEFSGNTGGTTWPIVDINGASVIDCILHDNTLGTAGLLTLSNASGGLIYTCSAYNNTGGSGIASTSYDQAMAINCVIDSSGTYNIDYGNSGTPQTGLMTFNCAVRAGGTANTTASQVRNQIGLVVLSGNPYTSTGTGDFSLNATAGQGGACRGGGYPTTFPHGTTANHGDIGAAQHADPVGGGGGGASASA